MDGGGMYWHRITIFIDALSVTIDQGFYEMCGMGWETWWNAASLSRRVCIINVQPAGLVKGSAEFDVDKQPSEWSTPVVEEPLQHVW